MRRGTRGRTVRVRRSPHLVAYWRGDTLLVQNCATGLKVEVPSNACDLLSFCDDWTKLADLENAGFVPSSTFLATVRKLVDLTLLERLDRPRDSRAVAMDALRPWNPQAGFFHATTKDVPFVSPSVAARRAKANGQSRRPPPAIKRYPNRPTLDLRAPSGNVALRAPFKLGARGVDTRHRRSPLMSWRRSLRSLPACSTGSGARTFQFH